MFLNYLITKELISKTLLDQHLEKMKKASSCIRYLAQHQLIPPEPLAKALSNFFQLPIIDLLHYHISTIPLKLIPITQIYKQWILPISQIQNIVTIAILDPTNTEQLKTIQFQIPQQINFVIARYDQLQAMIHQITMEHHEKTLNAQQSMESQIIDLNQNDDEPLIHYVNTLLRDAVKQQVSDIHFEVDESRCHIRFRQHGLLKIITHIQKDNAKRIAARLKIMCQLDIAEKRLPQDGHFKLNEQEHFVDVRVSTCPTVHGEKIVLRLLDHQQLLRDIQTLGFTTSQHHDFINAITKPQGLIIVTGPTGSGKTVTLYATLQYLNSTEKNILTIEDPVEINLCGINQVNVNPKIGLNFARTLRAFLRQDPDIIMVGEIRDTETATIAINAAQTGHLVLTTLHTNSATETLTRLNQMGIKDYDITSSLLLISAQRLVRKLCSHCKKTHPQSKKIIQQFNLSDHSTLYQAGQCEQCCSGYSSRMAVHEILTFENSQPKMNHQTIQQHALTLVSQGITSIEEIRRVINISLDPAGLVRGIT